MLSTPRLGIAYPQGTDTAVVPRDVYAVADYIDDYVTIFGSGTIAARPAATLAGRFYYATDNGILYFSTGTAWVALNDTIAAVPVGVVLDFAGGTVPTNYMLAVGTAVSRTTYADLYAQLGTKYGAGDGTTTFNLPDYRGCTSVMQARGATGANVITAATDRGVRGGLKEVTLTGPQSGIKAHAVNSGEGFETSGGADLGIGAPRVQYGTPVNVPIGNVARVPPSFGDAIAAIGIDLNTIRVMPHKHTITVAAASATDPHDNTMPWLACDKIIKVL